MNRGEPSRVSHFGKCYVLGSAGSWSFPQGWVPLVVVASSSLPLCVVVVVHSILPYRRARKRRRFSHPPPMGLAVVVVETLELGSGEDVPIPVGLVGGGN